MPQLAQVEAVPPLSPGGAAPQSLLIQSEACLPNEFMPRPPDSGERLATGDGVSTATEVVKAGALMTSQDLVLPGFAQLGIPRSGVAHGAIQVPTSGQPIILLADHPTTGGYPVIAVVANADLDAAGQLRPGQKLRFAIS